MSISNDEITPTNEDDVRAAMPLAGEIVSRVLNRPVQSVTPLVGFGSVNLTYFVATNGPELVVRMNKPEDDAAKMRGEYEKERWCIAQATAGGVPGPDVLTVGEHGGRAYMVQNRLPGVNGKVSELPRGEIWRALGRFAEVIHAIPVQGFGDDVAQFTNGDPESGWRRFVNYNLGELTDNDPLIALGVYKREQQNAIRAVFQWLQSLPLRVGLNHGDLAPRNTLVDGTGTISLLDWGCAEISVVPHYDLTQCLEWYKPDDANLSAFCDGYGITAPEWAALAPELRVFALLKAFDLTRWAIDRCPARTQEIAERAHRSVESFSAPAGLGGDFPRATP